MKKVIKYFFIILLIIVLLFLIRFILINLDVIDEKYYTDEDFNITYIPSYNDYNNNGVYDYLDILEGARIDARNKPKYDGNSYFKGGYPPDNVGVCTDVIWRALKHAGYDLKLWVDKDIENNIKLYPAVKGKQDKNIDFRRVRNLKVFMERHFISLTNDINDISSFRAGDIVIFGKDKHIGIISDKRNKRGIPFLIHNGGQLNREEDIIEKYIMFHEITGHYRIPNIERK